MIRRVICFIVGHRWLLTFGKYETAYYRCERCKKRQDYYF